MLLTNLITPPKFPDQIGNQSDWLRTEKKLGLTLPSDFREFVDSYGSGSLGGFFWIWNPYLDNFIEYVNEICEIDRRLQEQFPEHYPEHIYPERPGFLPCASDDNGNYYGWLTSYEPDDWTFMSHEPRGRGFKHHNVTFVEYFFGVFSKEIESLATGFPKDSDLRFEQTS